MEGRPREIEYYLLPNGKSPFVEWFQPLKSEKVKAVVLKRLARVRLGNLGEYRSVGQGVYEFKLDFGPGYRIYFDQEGAKLVVLLCAGEKSSQQKDIKKAQAYWEDYQRRLS